MALRGDRTEPLRFPARSGFICHRKYLEMYSNELPKEALAFVDKHMNGEDLLFNYMVANATGMGPIRGCTLCLLLPPLHPCSLTRARSGRSVGNADRRSEQRGTVESTDAHAGSDRGFTALRAPLWLEPAQIHHFVRPDGYVHRRYKD